VSTSNPTIPSGTLTRDIIRDLVADELQAWADDGTTSLSDPKSRGNQDAPFVVTSYPDQQTLAYPHIVVSEASISAQSFDNRHELHMAEVSILLTVEGRTSTETFGIKDGVREFVIQNQQDTLREGGLTDTEIDGSTAADFADAPETHSFQTTISGTVYTS
jgi:hypothetical protein